LCTPTIGGEIVVEVPTALVVIAPVGEAVADEAIVGTDVVPGAGVSLTVVAVVVPTDVVVTVVVSSSGKHATKEMTLPSGT
jgi:hypothetical protein